MICFKVLKNLGGVNGGAMVIVQCRVEAVRHGGQKHAAEHPAVVRAVTS